MKNENNSLLFSLIFSLNNKEDHEVTLEDLLYQYSPRVSQCQIKMYSLVIKGISEGMTYEEMEKFIENIDIEEFRKLTEQEKFYVKSRVKKDIVARKINEKKRGVI